MTSSTLTALLHQLEDKISNNNNTTITNYTNTINVLAQQNSDLQAIVTALQALDI